MTTNLVAKAGTEVRRVFGLAEVEANVDTGELVRVCVDGWPDRVIYRTELLIQTLEGFPSGFGKTEYGDGDVCRALDESGAFVSVA